jgi:hypothetical protein
MRNSMSVHYFGRLSHCRSARSQPEESTPPFLRLPVELLSQIMSHLDAPSKVCLTLVNRYLFSSLPHNPATSPSEKREIAAQVSGAGYCSRCLKSMALAAFPNRYHLFLSKTARTCVMRICADSGRESNSSRNGKPSWYGATDNNKLMVSDPTSPIIHLQVA